MGLSEHGDCTLQLIEEKCNKLAKDHIRDHVQAISGIKCGDLRQLFLKFEESGQEYKPKYKVIIDACETEKVFNLPIPEAEAGDSGKEDTTKPKPKPKPKPKSAQPDAAERIREALGLAGVSTGSVDEEAVNKLIESKMMPHFQDLQSEIDTLKSRPSDKLEIKFNGKVNTVTGHKHESFEQFVRVVTSRDEKGFYVPLWLWGDPGSGKSYIAWQLGEALGQEVYEKSVSPTDTSATIMGYRNLVNGDYVKGLIYEPYKNGGLVVIDEVCNADPSLPIAMNSILTGGKATFPNGETITKHEDFRVVVADNTKGTGATGGFRRQKMDVAFVNRFAQHKVEYDEKLERDIANPQGSKNEEVDRWVTYVQRVRAYVKANSPGNVYITPRVSINGAAMLRNELEWSWVADATLFSSLSSELVETIKQNVVFGPPSN